MGSRARFYVYVVMEKVNGEDSACNSKYLENHGSRLAWAKELVRHHLIKISEAWWHVSVIVAVPRKP
jgi:hypothetical protein